MNDSEQFAAKGKAAQAAADAIIERFLRDSDRDKGCDCDMAGRPIEDHPLGCGIRSVASSSDTPGETP